MNLQAHLTVFGWLQRGQASNFGTFQKNCLMFNSLEQVRCCLVVKWSLLQEGVVLAERFSEKCDQVICS